MIIIDGVDRKEGGKLLDVKVEGVEPTAATVDAGEYPLARPLFIYSDAGIMQDKPQVAAFVNFYLMNASELATEVGYFPAPADALAVHAAALTAVMTQVADDAAGLRDVLADPRKNAVVLGPGLGVGDATRAKVHAALSAPGPDAPRRSVVLDADALTSFADRPDELFAAVRSGEHRTVLTPHDGEFGRLFGKAVDPAADKLARTRAAAQVSGATVLLKGPDTVVADHDGRACVAMSQAPWLATAGSGDVLAGMVGGLLAQGMPPFQAASAAVWLHAAAAQRFGPGLISEDIPEALPGVLRDLFAGAEDG